MAMPSHNAVDACTEWLQLLGAFKQNHLHLFHQLAAHLPEVQVLTPRIDGANPPTPVADGISGISRHCLHFPGPDPATATWLGCSECMLSSFPETKQANSEFKFEFKGLLYGRQHGSDVIDRFFVCI